MIVLRVLKFLIFLSIKLNSVYRILLGTCLKNFAEKITFVEIIPSFWLLFKVDLRFWSKITSRKIIPKTNFFFVVTLEQVTLVDGLF